MGTTAKEVISISTAGTNRACSNKGSRENKCNNSVSSTEDRRGSTKPICNRDG